MLRHPGIGRAPCPTTQLNISEGIIPHYLSSKAASYWLWPPLLVSQRNLQESWKASASCGVWSQEPTPEQWERSSRDISSETPCGNTTINSETPEPREGHAEPCSMQQQLIFPDTSGVIWTTAAQGQYSSDSSSKEKSLNTVKSPGPFGDEPQSQIRFCKYISGSRSEKCKQTLL